MEFAKSTRWLVMAPAILLSLSVGDLANATEPGIDPTPGPLVRHTHDGLDKRRPGWSPDGKSLTFSRHEPDGKHLWQYVMGLEPSSPPRRLTGRQEAEFDGAFTPDGTRLLLVTVRFIALQGDLDISSVAVDGSGLRIVVTEEPGKVVHQEWPAWSADGKRFAFTSTHEGNQEVYTASADGTDVVRLTQHPGHDAHPCWAPDGKTVAFSTDRWGGLELATVRPDGTGVTRQTASPGLDDYPAVSPDGTRVAFVSNRDGQYEIYVADADGSNPINLTRHPLRDTFPTWTPDGRGVTFVSNRDGGFDLYTQQVGAIIAPPSGPGPATREAEREGAIDSGQRAAGAPGRESR